MIHLHKTLLAALLLCGYQQAVTAEISSEKMKVDTPLGKPQKPSKQQFMSQYLQVPLSFEMNKGQSDQHVKFLSRGIGYTLFLTPQESVFAFKSSEHKNKNSILRLQWVGANKTSTLTGINKLAGTSNYFLGKDAKAWRTNIPHFGKIKYHAIYPGIDLLFYGKQGLLEYDLNVAPGSDPKQINMRVQGAQSLAITHAGQLQITLPDKHKVTLKQPIAYQMIQGKQKIIPSQYQLLPGNQVAFDIASYDKTKPLVIDPVLEYSTYLGGSSNDFSFGIDVDNQRNMYVTGQTQSINFPTQGGLSPNTLQGPSDAFITKINKKGNALVYSTYLGGSASEVASSIVVDNQGNAYVTGTTNSPDFPTTVNAVQPALGGGIDAFVSKLNEGGNGLVFSTFLGGSAVDRGTSIAIDNKKQVYVTGITLSGDFPVQHPFQSLFAGGQDAFVTKLTKDGRALVYSTYLGGNNFDAANGIAVEKENAYVVGNTNSTNFPLSHPFQPTIGGGDDAFVTQFNKSGQALVYSTYLGGAVSDAGIGIAVNARGNAYITGQTFSLNFPTTPNAFQTSPQGSSDAFVTQFSKNGNALEYSTYLGGIDTDAGLGIALNSKGNAYVVGVTLSANFPAVNPIDSFFGGSDAFVTQLNVKGTALVFSTPLGGTGNDFGLSIRVGTNGDIYISGFTDSLDFPTKNPFQPTNQGANDAFVSIISGK